MNHTKFVLHTPEELARMAEPLPSDTVLLVDAQRERRDESRMGIRRRWTGLDHHRLCTLFADDPQWWRA